MSASALASRSRWRNAAALAFGLTVAGLIAVGILLELPEPSHGLPPAVLGEAMTCTPQAVGETHEPVLLVHGTNVDPESWTSGFGTALPALGFRTCTIRLPDRALGDLRVSSRYVASAIEALNAESGRRVDLLGHSQGGLVARWAVRAWPALQGKVDDLVTLGTPNHGLADGLNGTSCTACVQMMKGSDVIEELNRGDETPGKVSYASIYSLTDEVLSPASSSALAGARNVAIQEVCPGRTVSHVGILTDQAVMAVVLQVLVDPLTGGGAPIDRGVCEG